MARYCVAERGHGGHVHLDADEWERVLAARVAHKEHLTAQHARLGVLERRRLRERLHARLLDQKAYLVEEARRQTRRLLAQQAILGLGRARARQRLLAALEHAALRVHAVDETICFVVVVIENVRSKKRVMINVCTVVVVDAVVADHLDGRAARHARPAGSTQALVPTAHLFALAIATATVRTRI